MSACHKAPHTSGAKPPPVVTVRVETIEVKPHPVTEEVIGTVRAKIRAAVEAKVSGRITRMAVDLGQPVREGDLIAEIDAQEIKARLDQAVATREQAGQDLKRYTVLLEKQVAAKQEFDTAQARFRVADAAVKEAQAMLGYVEVRAPFAGVISRRLADAGDFASPGKPLVEIENPEVLRFEADVPEALIEKIRRGEDLAVRIPSIDGEIKGQVAEIAPRPTRTVGRFLCGSTCPPFPDCEPVNLAARPFRSVTRSACACLRPPWSCGARWRWFSSPRTARFGFVLSRPANDLATRSRSCLASLKGSAS